MKTELIRLAELEDPTPVLERVARQLAGGALVGIPTETVYGIAVNGDNSAAVARLIEVKQRPEEKKFSIHLGSVDEVSRYVDDLGEVGRRLARRSWPGPLTLLVKGRDGNYVGLRVPKNVFTCELIRRADVPVLAPSANL